MTDDLGDVEMLCNLAESAANKIDELLSMAQTMVLNIPEEDVAVFGEGVNVLADLSASLRTVSRRIMQRKGDTES